VVAAAARWLIARQRRLSAVVTNRRRARAGGLRLTRVPGSTKKGGEKLGSFEVRNPLRKGRNG
jgi:hypothetical protein